MDFREQLNHARAKTERVEVDALDGMPVWIGHLRADEAIEFHRRAAMPDANNLALAIDIVGRCIRDEAGHRVYSEDTFAEVAALPFAAIEQLGEVAVRVNHLDHGAREVAEGKSEPTSGGGSPTFSPESSGGTT